MNGLLVIEIDNP